MYLKLLYGSTKKQLRQLLLILFLLTFLFSMLLYSLHRQDLVEDQIKEAQTGIEIRGKVDKSPEQKYISSRVFNYFTDWELKPFVRDLALSSRVEIASGSLMAESEALDQKDEYSEILGLSAAEAKQTLAGQIVWHPGYSENFFQAEELEAVLLPQALYEKLNAGVRSISLELLPPERFTVPEGGFNDTVVNLNVAGYIKQDIASLTCSWQALCNWHREVFSNDLQYNYSLSFVLSDNSRLEKFRFKTMNVPADVLIYDEIYLERMHSLNRHSAYIEVLIPLIYLISLPLGIVSSFILLSERSKNIILMRVLGTASRTIFLLNNLESLFSSILSYALALLIVSVLGIRLKLYRSLLGLSLAVVYLLGTNISLFVISRKNLMTEVRKEMADE